MSTTVTEEETHRARDGLFYRTYEEMRDANIRYNEAHLKSLGLDDIRKRMKKTTKRAKNRPPQVRGKFNDGVQSPGVVSLDDTEATGRKRRSNRLRNVSPSSSRRSNRLRNVSPSSSPNGVDDFFESLEYSSAAAASVEKRKRRRGGGRGGARSLESTLSDEDRKKLADLPDWTSDMEDYLIKEENLSQPNYRNVMKQVAKLVSGVGVTYSRWSDGVSFYRGIAVDLSYDFNRLYDEAVDFENKHGRDLGNGWLLRHPIKKLSYFQRYYHDVLNQKQEEDS